MTSEDPLARKEDEKVHGGGVVVAAPRQSEATTTGEEEHEVHNGCKDLQCGCKCILAYSSIR